MPSILSKQYVVSRLRAIMPEQETVVLYSLQTDETYPATGVSWTAKREELSLDEIMIAAENGSNYAIAFTFFEDISTAILTLTVVGTITGDGNASVVVTASEVTGSPVTTAVAVLTGDTASVVGGKVRTALGLVSAITDKFTISGSGAEVILTQRYSSVPATQTVTIDNGTCTGLTAAESVQTSVAPTPPRTDDRLVDATGVTWTIGNVSPTKLFKGVHRVACIRNY